MKADKKALISVILGNTIFGFSFLFSKIALEITIPSVLIAVRFTVAFIVLNIFVFLGQKIKRADGTTLLHFSVKGKPLKYILLLGLFQPIIYFIAENYGIVYTSSAFAGIIIAIIPIAGVILDVLIMGTKVSLRQVICAVASVAGVAITTISATHMTSSTKGLILLLIAVLAGSLFYVFSKKSSDFYSPLERTYMMFGMGSAFYVTFALIQCAGNYEELIFYPLSRPIFWGCILYLSVVSSVIAFLLLNYGSNYISVSSATIFANFTTIISIAAGVLILGESFSMYQLLGACIILVSVYFSSK